MITNDEFDEARGEQRVFLRGVDFEITQDGTQGGFLLLGVADSNVARARNDKGAVYVEGHGANSGETGELRSGSGLDGGERMREGADETGGRRNQVRRKWKRSGLRN
jgi:hypothetical protein